MARRKSPYGGVVMETIPPEVSSLIRRRTSGLVRAAVEADPQDGVLEMAVRSAYLQGAIDAYDGVNQRAEGYVPEYVI